MLLTDLLKEYFFHVQIKGHTQRTLKTRRTNLKAFIKYLENEFEVTELEEVKAIHIKKYGMFLLQKDLKVTSYINNIYKSIRSYFNYSVDEGYILKKHNPSLDVNWLKEEKPVIKAFTQKEVCDLVNAFKMTTYTDARNKCSLLCC